MYKHTNNMRGLRGLIAAVRVFVFGALWVTTFVGIGTPGFAQIDQTVITLVAWQREGGPELAMCSRMVNKYSETHPDIRIDMRHDDWSNAHQMLKRWQGAWRDSAPDMVVVPDEWLAEFESEFYKFGRSLDGELKDFIPGVLTPVRRDNRVYGIPWRMDSLALYYRTDLLPKDMKVPETWDDVAAAGRAMADRAQNIYGLGMPGAVRGGGARLLLAMLWGNGGKLRDETDEIDFTSAQMQAALGKMVELAENGVLQPEALSWSSDQCQKSFAEGKLGMVIAGSALSDELRNKYGTLKWGVAPLPYSDTPVAAISSTYLVTLRSSKYREECLEFMRYMTSQTAREAMVASGSVPAHRVLIAKAKNDRVRGTFCANLENAQSRPTDEWKLVEAMLEDAIYLALSGRVSTAMALERVQAQYGEEPGIVAPPALFGG